MYVKHSYILYSVHIERIFQENIFHFFFSADKMYVVSRKIFACKYYKFLRFVTNELSLRFCG